VYVMPLIFIYVTNGKQANEVLVACEGLPALFSFTVGGAANANAIRLQGNALDVAIIATSQTSWSAIVSVDNVHKPGSTTEVRNHKVSVHSDNVIMCANTVQQDASRLQYFSRSTGEQWHEDANLQGTFGAFAEGGSKLVSRGGEDTTGPASKNDKTLRDILYNVENLRKRPGTED
jgi:tRNA (guanine-N(7)-)-methyltransferase subunit TRM82